MEDGVDVLSLSIGPSSIPPGPASFLNILEMELLLATKAGVFVVQAAGNGGPGPSSILSFSPWIMSVAASSTDRKYNNSMRLGSGQSLSGIGLSRTALMPFLLILQTLALLLFSFYEFYLIYVKMNRLVRLEKLYVYNLKFLGSSVNFSCMLTFIILNLLYLHFNDNISLLKSLGLFSQSKCVENINVKKQGISFIVSSDRFISNYQFS